MDNQSADCGAQNQGGHSDLVAGTTSNIGGSNVQQQATHQHGENETNQSIIDSNIPTLINSEPLPGSPVSNESPDFASGQFAKLDEDRIVKHIMVIGFHHKHGYQVDYCYPPLESSGPVFSTASKPISLPSCWKTLPLLCLPDGSHNYDSDTIYFTMPDNLQQQQQSGADDIEDSGLVDNGIKSNEGIKTIFGTACYRQIQADKLVNRTDDITRVAVQKSVCVLSTKPLFGLIRSKLEMITHAYFEELDFSKVRILKLTYDNLNSLLSRDSVKENATFLGLSARNLVSQFQCNMLVLFKAMLLEKKILFYKSPVRDLCSTIMSMCSLFTGLLESGGLDYSTCDLQLSPNLEALKLLTPYSELPNAAESNCDEESKRIDTLKQEGKVFFSPSKQMVVIMGESNLNTGSDPQSAADLIEQQTKMTDEMMSISLPPMVQEVAIESQGKRRESDLEQTSEYEVISEDNEIISDGSIVDDPYALKLCRSKPEECGLPLQIFTRGSFCLPYLSISYLDLISDKRVRSFVIGATNFLFKQRREIYDVIVDMEDNTIIINDPSLKRCLILTTEDLRFMDYLNKHVKLDHSKPKDEFDLISNDITKWVGGDEWIRYHFRLYTLYLLKASKNPSSYELFNSNFVQTWKQSTNNYKIWDSSNKASILGGIQREHLFSSATKGLNFSDMRLKLSYAVNSSEKGRMINQTLTGIGKWSIWNNLASAAQAATTASVSLASTASNSAAASTLASTLQATFTNNQADSTTKKQTTTTSTSNLKDHQDNNGGCARDI